MNLSIKLACLFLLGTQNFIAYGDFEIEDKALVAVAGITSLVGVAALISGVQKKALRAKGHQLHKPTDQIAPYTPGTNRWNNLHTATKISTVVTGLLALGTTLNGLSSCYGLLINSYDLDNVKNSIGVSFILSPIFCASSLATYYIQKYAAMRSKKFTEEYSAANPETYKEQIARNKAYVAEKDAILMDAIHPDTASFDLEIYEVDSLIAL